MRTAAVSGDRVGHDSPPWWLGAGEATYELERVAFRTAVLGELGLQGGLGLGQELGPQLRWDADVARDADRRQLGDRTVECGDVGLDLFDQVEEMA